MWELALEVAVSVAIVCLGVPIVIWGAVTVLKKAFSRE